MIIKLNAYRKVYYESLQKDFVLWITDFFHEIQIFTFIFLFFIKYVYLYRLIFAKVLF